MIGKEIADAIAPIVMWIAIVGGALALVGLIVWRIRKSARKEERLAIVTEAAEEEADARESIRDKTKGMRARLRARRARRRLQDDEGPELPPAG